MRSSVFVALVVLLALSTSTLAQLPSIVTLAPFIGRGFDIVTERVKAPFAQWTYYDQFTMMWNGQEYLIPDQVIENLTPRTLYDSEYLQVTNVEDYFRYYVSQKSIGLSLTYAGFTLSAAFSRTKGEIQSFLKNNTRITSTINNVALMFQLSLLERLTESNLERRFNDAVRNLPLEYDANSYRRFLNQWGTHYFITTQMGAKVNFTSAFDKDLAIRRGAEWTSQQTSVSVGYAMFSVGVTSSLAKADNNVDIQYREGSTVFKTVIGGSAAILESQGFVPWVTDAKSNPALLLDSSKLAPITDLVFHETRKRFLGQALVEYCNQAQEE